MPLSVPAFADDKNKVEGKGYILLFELEHEAGSFTRYARYDTNITFEGVVWQKFPIGTVEVTHGSRGEIPVWNISFSNVGREVQSILEFYTIEGRPGRFLWVHPDKLADPDAKIQEKWVVASAQADNNTATLTVSAVKFDLFGVQLPAEIVTLDKFPGVLGNRARYL